MSTLKHTVLCTESRCGRACTLRCNLILPPDGREECQRIHPASWVFGSRSGGPNLWAPTMRVTGTAVGHISGIVEYDGKPPGSQKTQPLHFISGQTSPGGDVTPKHEISEPMLLAKLKHTSPLILTSLTASGELSPKCHLSISFPNYHPFQAGHSHKSLFFFFLALLPLIVSFPLVR